MRRSAISLLLAVSACTAASPTASTLATPTTVTPAATTALRPTTTAIVVTTSTVEPTTRPAPPRCRPDPFTGLASTLAAEYPGRLITAHVHDLDTGCEYSLNADNRQRTASVFKVIVLAGTLLEAQRSGRDVSEWEMSQLVPMITMSTNPQVRSLWHSFGASPWFEETRREFGLGQTTVTADNGSAWGLTLTSARDQVQLLRQVLIGQWGPIGSEYREVALDLMTSVVADQTWGVKAGVPDDWTVAQKNGFAGITINSVGWADPPGSDQGYLVAILSQGWPDHPAGIAAVEVVSEAIALIMTSPLPE